MGNETDYVKKKKILTKLTYKKTGSSETTVFFSSPEQVLVDQMMASYSAAINLPGVPLDEPAVVESVSIDKTTGVVTDPETGEGMGNIDASASSSIFTPPENEES
jgi:hypothetical protein